MSKTLLITGASSGIGTATASFFQEKGWKVVATMRSPENEEELPRLDNVAISPYGIEAPATRTEPVGPTPSAPR